jgi:hypothetical protein
MSVLLSTTGLVSSITIDDLGGRTYAHPSSNVELAGTVDSEYTYSEVRESYDLGVALDAGYISMTNNGIVVGDSDALRKVQPEPNTDTGSSGVTFADVWAINTINNC